MAFLSVRSDISESSLTCKTEGITKSSSETSAPSLFTAHVLTSWRVRKKNKTI